MKTSNFAAAALFGLEVVAFPSWLMDRELDDEEMRKVARIAASIEIEAANIKRNSEPRDVGFDAEAQYVSTSGDHEFQAPGKDDLRGPCPGLNAMANHGYLPRNGVGSMTDFIQGTYDVFGMGLDIATFLAIYGSVYDGDLTSWSIGGPPPAGLLDGLGLLGRPGGISNSHNHYEGDGSPTRGDLYEYGDAYKVQVSQFQELYDEPQGDFGYDIPTLVNFRAKRFQESIDNNPYFFNGVFSGVIAQPAAYSFIYRFMANKSEEYPEGYLDGNTLKSFYSITGDSGDFQYAEGHERIPENWYKRAIGDEYTIPFFLTDMVPAALQHPEFLDIGGNTGQVDTFTGVDVAEVTKGVYDASTLLEGNNAACFALQFSKQVAPSILQGGIFASLLKPLAKLGGALDTVIDSLSCPQLASVDTSQFDQFPGAKGGY